MNNAKTIIRAWFGQRARQYRGSPNLADEEIDSLVNELRQGEREFHRQAQRQCAICGAIVFDVKSDHYHVTCLEHRSLGTIFNLREHLRLMGMPEPYAKRSFWECRDHTSR